VDVFDLTHLFDRGLTRRPGLIPLAPMEVKGTAFLARKSMLIQELGEPRFAAFLASYALEDPFFTHAILATTAIPIEKFLAFNDAIVRDLYGGDTMSYFRFGEKSAEWALMVGPYKNLRESKSLEKFAEMGCRLYQNYFTDGRAETWIVGTNKVEVRILGVPAEHRHVYFEYAIVAYFKRGLELVGAKKVTMRRINGFSIGGTDVHYEYRLR
jgi:hypothetical protein